MKTRHIVPALLFAGLFATSAQAADSFAGEWVTHVGEAKRAYTCVITQKDKAISGNCNMTMGNGQVEAGPLTGTVNGKNVTWTVTMMSGEMSQISEFTGQWDLKNTANLTGTLKGVTLNGKPQNIPPQTPRSAIFTRTPAK